MTAKIWSEEGRSPLLLFVFNLKIKGRALRQSFLRLLTVSVLLVFMINPLVAAHAQSVTDAYAFFDHVVSNPSITVDEVRDISSEKVQSVSIKRKDSVKSNDCRTEIIDATSSSFVKEHYFLDWRNVIEVRRLGINLAITGFAIIGGTTKVQQSKSQEGNMYPQKDLKGLWIDVESPAMEGRLLKAIAVIQKSCVSITHKF